MDDEVWRHQLGNLAEELRFLRDLVEALMDNYDIPWSAVLSRLHHWNSPVGRTAWRISYVLALEEAVAADRKVPKVLTQLPFDRLEGI
jgi:hypothetical protein